MLSQPAGPFSVGRRHKALLLRVSKVVTTASNPHLAPLILSSIRISFDEFIMPPPAWCEATRKRGLVCFHAGSTATVTVTALHGARLLLMFAAV